MQRLEVEFDVLNPEELMKKKKGRILSKLASIFISRSSIKQKVELAILAEMKKKLGTAINEKLQSEGVEAVVRVKLSDDKEEKLRE